MSFADNELCRYPFKSCTTSSKIFANCPALLAVEFAQLEHTLFEELLPDVELVVAVFLLEEFIEPNNPNIININIM